MFQNDRLEANDTVDEENLRHDFDRIDAETLDVENSQVTMEVSAHGARGASTRFSKFGATPGWPDHDEDVENDVPASLLVEANEQRPNMTTQSMGNYHTPLRTVKPDTHTRTRWQPSTTSHQTRQTRHDGRPDGTSMPHPRSLMSGLPSGGRREKALWRWANISNLDSFMRDVYDYYEGGGLLCILCSNALWLL
jgi:autophagy-related protein 9